MIDIQALDFSYQKELPILNSFNLKVDSGEVVVLCGESGCGKSTFLKILNGLIPELYQGQLSGRGQVFQHNLFRKDFSEYVKDLGVVFQNPKTQFFTNDVYSELAFVMENYGEEASSIRTRINEIAEQLHLTELVDRNMFALSGGQKQLIAFASACMLPHSLFILDEPSSNLDTMTINRLKTYLHFLKKKGLTIIIAEHRLYYLRDIADRYCLVKDGHIIESFTAANFIQKTPVEIRELRLRSLLETSIRKKTIQPENLKETNGFTLQCQDLNFHYLRQKAVITIPSLTLNSHTIIGIIGENGAGKSTFIKLLSGLLKAKSGQIVLDGKKKTTKTLLQQSFTVMQDVNLQLFFETVEKELTVKAENTHDFNQVVENLHLQHLLQQHPQRLSGGEKQRVAIASALLSGKKIIILDEPTSGLDLTHMENVSQMIHWLHQQNMMIIIVTHDKEFLQQTCQRILQFEAGKVIDDFYL